MSSRVHFLSTPLSQLAPNASRYEIRFSAPDSSTLSTLWLVWAAFGLLSTLATGILILAIFSSRKARASAFNLYLAGLAFPDFFNGANSTLVALLNYSKGAYWSEAVCEWQNFFVVFGFTGSFWMNALVAFEVYKMLRMTRKLESYMAPSRRTVLLRCMMVYAFACFMASWGLWGVIPMKVQLHRGALCLANETSAESALFFWAFAAFWTSGLPIMIALFVGVMTWYNRLLPTKAELAAVAEATSWNVVEAGKKRRQCRRAKQAREISLYFIRIFICLLLWFPTTVCYFDLRSVLPLFIASTWCFCQAIVQVLTSLTKHDVCEAVCDLMLCRLCRPSTVAPTGHTMSLAEQVGIEMSV